MQSARVSTIALLFILAGCGIQPFRSDSETGIPSTAGSDSEIRDRSGSAPQLGSVQGDDATELRNGIDAPAPTAVPQQRAKTAPATLSPASQALVSQARSQRKNGDLPGATVSLERALRIEPNNPLLWIEMGRLRIDQGNPSQAEGMGRKALSASVGDDRTQAEAWNLIADSLRIRGRNTQAEEAREMARALSAQ